MKSAVTSLVDLPAFVRAMCAAFETGLIRALAREDGLRVCDAAKKLDLSDEALERLFDVLKVVGFLEWDGDVARLSYAAAQVENTTPGGWDRKWRTLDYMPYVRGVQVTEIGGPAERSRTYAQVVHELWVLFQEAAALLAVQLGGTSNAILDLGCGSGVWSLELARRQRTARTDGVDLPQVIPEFLAHAQACGLRERVRGIPGNYHSVALEKEYDLIILANVLHLEDEVRARALLKRAVDLALPNGRIVIVDALVNGSSEVELARALYHLDLGRRSGGVGGVRDVSKLAAWAREQGAEMQHFIPLTVRRPLLGALVLVPRQ